MKRIITTVSIILLGLSTMAYAGATDCQSNMEGGLNIAGTAPRADVDNLAVSMNSFVTYASSSVTTCAVAAASGKANDDEVLMFEALGNQTPGQTDDSNIYQKKLGSTPTGAVTPEAPTSSAGWVIRGTGSTSSFTGSI